MESKGTFRPAALSGVGSILMHAIVELSKEQEFKGRVGLHSLPQANSFYANTCGMTDLEIDPAKEGLHYFEMTPEQAEAFIAKSRSEMRLKSQRNGPRAWPSLKPTARSVSDW